NRAVGADVLLDDVDAVDRHVQPVATQVLEMKVVALRVGDREMAQSLVAADAVIEVDDVVLRLQLREAREELADVARPAATTPALAEDLLFGHDREMLDGEMEAAVELADQDHATEVARQLGELAVEDRHLELVHREQSLQAIGLRTVVDDEHDPVAV